MILKSKKEELVLTTPTQVVGRTVEAEFSLINVLGTIDPIARYKYGQSSLDIPTILLWADLEEDINKKVDLMEKWCLSGTELSMEYQYHKYPLVFIKQFKIATTEYSEQGQARSAKGSMSLIVAREQPKAAKSKSEAKKTAREIEQKK